MISEHSSIHHTCKLVITYTRSKYIREGSSPPRTPFSSRCHFCKSIDLKFMILCALYALRAFVTPSHIAVRS